MTKRYDTYKNSGVQWLGEIPGHWGMIRNKSVLKITDEKVGDRKDITLLSLTKQGVIIRDLSEGKGKFPKDFETYLVVRPNNLVFCLFDVDETPRTVGLVHNYGMLTGAYTNFEVDESIVLPEFIYNYYLQVDDVKGLRPYYTGLRKVVKTNTFLQLRFPLPPLPEQHSIVSYLDDKCAKIDKMLEGKQKQIELLAEMKQRIIADAVTRGLNPDVKMKATNIPWLPEIPEHWEQRKMKYVFDERSEKNHPDEPMLSATQTEGVILQSKYKGRVVVVTTGFEGLKLVKVGDFVIHLRSFQGGIEYAYDQGIISSAYTILNPKHPEYSVYYRYLFKSSNFIDLLKTCVTGIREGQNINYSKLKQNFIPVPPLSEQRAIVSYITDKTTKIDTLAAKLQQEIESIKEYKQRLISDVVTGQIKVC